VNIPFCKMHGAGNDFILIDDRAKQFPIENTSWISSVAARRTGVGCDGIILIQPSSSADIRMRFINPDGNEVEMCGNGARCVARLAHELHAAPAQLDIETIAGKVHAEVLDEGVRIHLTAPTDWRMGCCAELKDGPLTYCFVNTGVPHAVLAVPDLDKCPVQQWGKAMRYHADFATAGTNVNFMSVLGPQRLAVRTYERGVEAETLACGTGVAAAALVAARLGKVTPPVTILVGSGDTLEVNFALTDDGAENVSLIGPAEHVFQGTLRYEHIATKRSYTAFHAAVSCGV